MCVQNEGYNPGVTAESHPYMENTLQVYGLQHLVHNLNQDVHKVLKYFDEYYEHLRNLSKLLAVDDRRRRFIVHCVEPSRYASDKWRLKKFAGHLYVKRWKEVTRFSKALLKVIWLVAETWDAEKYKGHGAGIAQDITDEDDPLDIGKISTTLCNNLFRRYLVLVVSVDSIPEDRIAAWGSTCPCHELLREAHKMSDYLFDQMIETHYGPGCRTCILNGLRSGDLAAGHIKVLFCFWFWFQAHGIILCKSSGRSCCDIFIRYVFVSLFEHSRCAVVQSLVLNTLEVFGRGDMSADSFS